MKKLNIAIIGLGNIGSYLYKYLNQNKKIISKKIIAYLISHIFQLKIRIEKEILRLIRKFG